MTGPYGDLSSPALPGNTGACSEKKRKKVVFDPSSKLWMCSECHTPSAPSSDQRLFGSRQAACGHMQVHTRLAKQQAEGSAPSSAVEAQRKKIHEDLDLNKKPPEDGNCRAMQDPLSKLWMCGQCLTSGRSKMFKSRQAANGHMQIHTSLVKQQAEGGKKKRTAKVSYDSGKSQSCSLRRKQLKNHQAHSWHNRVDNNQPQRQVHKVHEEKEKELARTSLKFGQGNLKGDGSTMAEDGASLLAAEEALRKEFHMKLDLNKVAPVDDGNDEEKCA